MTYDYHGTWESKTGLIAPLYGPGIYTVDQTINYWISKIGSSKNKLLMGIPLYGPYWQLLSSDRGLGAKAKPMNIEPYSEMCLRVKNMVKIIFDEKQKATYAYGVYGQWVSYEDEKSIQAKINYVNSKQIGGMFVWSMDSDDNSKFFFKFLRFFKIKN